MTAFEHDLHRKQLIANDSYAYSGTVGMLKVYPDTGSFHPLQAGPPGFNKNVRVAVNPLRSLNFTSPIVASWKEVPKFELAAGEQIFVCNNTCLAEFDKFGLPFPYEIHGTLPGDLGKLQAVQRVYFVAPKSASVTAQRIAEDFVVTSFEEARKVSSLEALRSLARLQHSSLLNDGLCRPNLREWVDRILANSTEPNKLDK